MKTLFITNINFDATVEDLQDLLDEYQPAHIHIVREHPPSNRSRGFGFVEFKDDEAADRVINDLDGVHFMGRILTVQVSQPKKYQRQL